MNELPISDILKADTDISEMLKGKIFEDVAPFKTTSPYLVWTDISGTPNTSIDNITNEDDVSYQLMIYSPNRQTASEIRTAVANVLSEHSLIDQRFGTYETETKLFGRGFSGNWWLNR